MRTTLLLLLLLAPIARAQDCEAMPLPRPVVSVAGEEGPTRKEVRLDGRVKVFEVAPGGGARLVLDTGGAERTIEWVLPREVAVDLDPGRQVSVVYRFCQGFKGAATGLLVEDAAGIVLLVDDGAYGNAFGPGERGPFEISQADAGCRNRANHSGDLNNCYLVVRLGDEEVRLIHGDSAGLGGYSVLAIESTARVGDVRWTDAPYEYVAYAIARRPK